MELFFNRKEERPYYFQKNCFLYCINYETMDLPVYVYYLQIN